MDHDFESMLDAGRVELEIEAGSYGDPRRCQRHGTTTSSADGMFDGLCGACEHEADEAEQEYEWNALTQAERDAFTAEVEAFKRAEAERVATVFGPDDIAF